MNPIIYPGSIILGATLLSVAKSRTVTVCWPEEGVRARLKKATDVALTSLCFGFVADCLLSTHNLGILAQLAAKTGNELTLSALKCSLIFGGLFLCSGLLTYAVTSTELRTVRGLTYPQMKDKTDAKAETLREKKLELLGKTKTLQERAKLASEVINQEIEDASWVVDSFDGIQLTKDSGIKTSNTKTLLKRLADALQVFANGENLSSEVKWTPYMHSVHAPKEQTLEAWQVVEDSIVLLTSREGCEVKNVKSYLEYEKPLKEAGVQFLTQGVMPLLEELITQSNFKSTRETYDYHSLCKRKEALERELAEVSDALEANVLHID